MTRTRNEIVITAPLGLVWEMTNDVAAWPELFTEYAAAEILEQDETSVVFRLTTHPDEEGRSWSWVSRRVLDAEGREVRATRIEPGPFEYMNIHWTYQEVSDGTLMTWMQEFRMKPEAPVDDQAMADRINSNSPVQMRAIKEKIEAAAADRVNAQASDVSE